MPGRLRDVSRVLKKLGGRVEEPTSGSHWKAFSEDGKFYPLPAHNGLKTELDDKYLRGLCTALCLDFENFKKLL